MRRSPSLLALSVGITFSAVLGARMPQTQDLAQGETSAVGFDVASSESHRRATARDDAQAGEISPSALITTVDDGVSESKPAAALRLVQSDTVRAKRKGETTSLGVNGVGREDLLVERQQPDPATLQADGEASDELGSQTRRKLLQFGYNPALLDEIFVQAELQRLQAEIIESQARIAFLTAYASNLYQTSLAFSPGGAFNPFGRRRLLGDNRLVATNLKEASQEAH